MKALAKFKRVAVAACAVAAGLFAQSAKAEMTSYWAWDASKEAVAEQAPVNAGVLSKTILLASEGDTTLADGSWWVVKGELKTDGGIGNIIVEPEGTVNIILADDADFQLDECSLIVNKGSTLNIYGQAKNTGKLTVDLYKDDDPTRGKSFNAAIGGAEEQSNGAINIHGGVITAKGWWGAGIGAGGADGEYDLPDQEGIITFYGGVVNAYSRKGAGIGSGSDTDAFDDGEYGNGGLVRTFGGVVVGCSDGNGAGIGGGCSGNGGRLYADGACIVGINPGDWNAFNPAHGFGKGYYGEANGTLTVDGSANYEIKSADCGDVIWEGIKAEDLEADVRSDDWTDLSENVYYFSWTRTIGINPAPHLDVSYTLLQQDGTEGESIKVEGKKFVNVNTFYGLTENPGYYPFIGTAENVGISNGVHVVYTCQSGYTFPDGSKTRDLWIAPSRVRKNLNLEVGGVGPYDLPAPVAEKVYHKLSMPDVDDATWTVTTNGVKVADLAKILNGTEVLVTWTAREGYVITSGETETFTMTADYTAKTPTVVRAQQTYRLTLPLVANVTVSVKTNGVEVADRTKILKGTEVTVKWTAIPGYTITSGETETFTMTADYVAKAPTVVAAPIPPVSEFLLYPNGDGGKFSPAEKGKKTFLGAIVNTNSGEVAGSITVTLKAPNKKGLFDVSATVKTLTGKKSYSFKAKKIEVPTNDAPYTVHMELNKKSEHHELDVVFDGDSVTGVFDFQNKVDAALDVFAIKGHTKQAALTPEFITTWAGALESTGSNEIYSVSAKVSKNGKTKVTVMMPDGKKANCSSKAVVGANGVLAVPVTLWPKVNKQKATIGFWLTFQKTGEATICAVQRLSAVRDQATEAKLVGLSFTAGDAAALSLTSAEFKTFVLSFSPAAATRGELTKNGLKLAKTGFVTGSLTWGSGKTKVQAKAYGVMVGRKGVATLKLKDGTTDYVGILDPAIVQPAK